MPGPGELSRLRRQLRFYMQKNKRIQKENATLRLQLLRYVHAEIPSDYEINRKLPPGTLTRSDTTHKNAGGCDVYDIEELN